MTFLPSRALGDVFSQKIEGTKRTDYKRALMTAGYGIAFIGAWRGRQSPLLDHAMQDYRVLRTSSGCLNV